MSIHNKMASDYLWVRHAPVEEGAKIKYRRIYTGTSASTTCTNELPIEWSDSKWCTGAWASNTTGNSRSSD